MDFYPSFPQLVRHSPGAGGRREFSVRILRSKIENRKSKIRIAVIGPGGIGCLFSGLLAEGGHDVCLVDRRPDRSSLIAREGLIIENNGNLRKVPLRAHAYPAEIGPVELIILCVKAHETAGTINSVLALAAPETAVLSLQNGLGNLDVLERAVQGKNLYAGVTTHGATVIGLNHIRHAGSGATLIGSLHQNKAGAVNLAEILTRARIESSAAPDTLAMLWSKLVINAAILPVSVMANLPNGQLAEDKKWRPLMGKAAEEAAAVAAAKGITLMFSDPAGAVLEVCRNTAGNISSMLQDVRRGRKTEIEAINGAIVAAAGELGIKAPTNGMLYQSVIDRENQMNIKGASEAGIRNKAKRKEG